MNSRNATIAGFLAGTITAGIVFGPLSAGPVLAIGVGVTVAVATGLELWAVPKLNRRLGEGTGSQRFAALSGGVAGIFISVPSSTLAVGMVRVDVSIGAMLAMMAFLVALFVLGVGGAVALVVHRLSAMDVRVVPPNDGPMDATGRPDGIPTENGHLSLLVGVLVGTLASLVAVLPLDAGAFLAAGTGFCGGTAAGLYVWTVSGLNDLFSGLEGSSGIDYRFFAAVGSIVGVLSVLPLAVPIGGLALAPGVELTIAGLGFFVALLGAGCGIALVVVRLSAFGATMELRSDETGSSTGG